MKRFKPGVSFSDYVIVDFKTKPSRIQDDRPVNFRKGWFLGLLVLVSYVFVLGRLFELNILKGDKFRVIAQENRIKKVSIPAQRGEILDRNGIKIAYSKPKEASESGKKAVDTFERVYPYKEYTAHALGYVSEVLANQVGILKNSIGQKYELGDIVGVGGVEKIFEDRLKGVDGGKIEEIDYLVLPVRLLGKKEPASGENVKVSLDAELSRVGYIALGGKKGAVVASDPTTGEILALVSSPSFDASSNFEKYSQYASDANMPFLNRAISGAYAPGSVFKMAVTLAGIESQKAGQNFLVEDTGQIMVGNQRFTNWFFTKRGGLDGLVDHVRAIQRSNDIFYYKLAMELGPESIYEWSKKVGYGSKSGIEIDGEVEGLVATPKWKEEVKKERWFTGNTVQMGIGQGDILATPIQVNVATGVWAVGSKCKPNFGEKKECEDMKLSSKSLETIREGMKKACENGGTGWPFFRYEIEVGCKTGTAEYVTSEGKLRTHAWFTAYAPFDNPKIAITALVEGGGEGSNVAAPIVRKMMSQYFGINDKFDYSQIRPEGE